MNHTPFLKSVILFFLCTSGFTYNISGQNIETVVQTGHYGIVSAVCYSNDGKLIATGSSDKTIKLWRSTDGKEIRTFLGNKSGVQKLEFNKTGNWLLSLSKEGIVMIWNVATGQLVKQLDIDNFTCASFHPNGMLLVTCSKKLNITVWDINKAEPVKSLQAQPVDLSMEKNFDFSEMRSVCYSKDGKYIVAGAGNYTAILWDAESGKELNKFWQSYHVCTSCITTALITPDNKYVLSAHSDSVKIFDKAKGTLVYGLKNKGDRFSSLTISSDGRFVAAIESGMVDLWNLTSRKLLYEKGDNTVNILSVAISPDGKQMVTGNENRMADIWDISTGKKIMTLKGYLNQVDERILNNPNMYWAGLVNEAKLSPDGKLIAIGRTGNNAKLIDFKTGKVQKTLSGHSSMVIALNFSNDGKYLATGGLDGKAILWDVKTGEQVKSFEYGNKNLTIFSVDISPDNRMLAAAAWDGQISFWNMETGKFIKSITPHENNSCYHIKFTANGLYIISAGLDRKLKLIEIDTGEEIKTFVGHTGMVTSINLDPTGNKIITASMDQSIRIWDLYSGLQIRKINAHDGGVYSAKFDTTGKYIVSGGDDNKVKLWDASNGVLLSEFSGHRGCIGDVNITPDNKYIISGSRDGSVRIWNVEEKRELISMTFLNSNDWFIKNTEGYFDASEGAFGLISFVKGTEIYSIGQFFNEFYRPGLYAEAFTYAKPGYRQNMMKNIETFPPPKIEIISPEPGTMENNAITVLVKVTNSGGGVKELKVMHNGKRQLIDESDIDRLKREGQSVTKSFELELVPGENEISVSAFSNGEIESEPVNLSLNYKGLQKLADCYIFSIGINKYENEELNLKYARPDAQAVADLISKQGKEIFNKIYTITLFDKDATKQNIFAKFDELKKTMKKEDVFVFFYAGHGSVVDNYFYFITSENTGMYQTEKLKNAIHVKELQEKFKMMPALKQVVFIDACHSGNSVDLLAMRGATEEKALAQLSRSSGIHVMASSESQQQAAEIQSLGHGVFTYVLLEAMNGKADGSPKDSKITVYEIKSYVDDQVPDISYHLIRHKQFPSTFSIGHDFPLVMTGK
jgi:WD40 repeat protein